MARSRCSFSILIRYASPALALAGRPYQWVGRLGRRAGPVRGILLTMNSPPGSAIPYSHDARAGPPCGSSLRATAELTYTSYHTLSYYVGCI